MATRKKKLSVSEDEGKRIDSHPPTTIPVVTKNGLITTVSLLPHVYYNAGVSDIGKLLSLNGFFVLQRVCQTLAEARSVVVITTHEDRCVLVPMQRAAVQCSFNWRFRDGFSDEGMGPPLDLKPGEVVVVISTAPYSPYNIGAAWLARNVGALLIGITDSSESPVARVAHDVLIIPAQEHGHFKSYVAATALVEMMVLMAAGRRGDRGAPGAEGSAMGGTPCAPIGAWSDGTM